MRIKTCMGPRAASHFWPAVKASAWTAGWLRGTLCDATNAAIAWKP